MAYTAALKANPNHANARYSIGQLKLNSAAISAKGREAKFGAVMIPAFKLEDATLQEALAALSTIIEKESKDEVVPISSWRIQRTTLRARRSHST